MSRRLSSIHLLPRETDEIVAEAIAAAIVSSHMTQMGALEWLNDRLSKMGVDKIAKSSWARFLARLIDDGIPARWRREEATSGETVTIDRSRYVELLEAEAALLKQRLAR